MMRKPSGLSVIPLLLVLAATTCPAQEPPATQPAARPPAARSVADLTDAELVALAEQAGATRRYAEAIDLLQFLIQRGPVDVSPEAVLRVLNGLGGAAGNMSVSELLDLAGLFRQLRQYSNAIALISNVLRADRNNIEALRLAGDIAWDMQDAEQAKKYWDLVTRIQPNDFAANWGLGRLWLRSGQPRQAMGYLETAMTVVPPDRTDLQAEVRIILAQAYGAMRDFGPAIETVQQALELDHQNLNAWSVLTTLRAQDAVTLDDLNEALAAASQLATIAESAIETNGMTPEGLQTLSQAYALKLRVLGSYENVLFERNADGTPSDRLLPDMDQTAADINIAIVDTWMKRVDLQRSIDRFQILEFAKTAAGYAGGTRPEILLRIGSLQVATGQFADATETLERVLELDPANEPARQQLEALLQRQPTSAPAP